MKRILVLVSLLMLVGSVAFGFGLPSIGGSGSGGSGLSADQLQGKLDAVSKDYFGATKNLMMSMCTAQDAFGLKKEAEITKAEAEQLDKGVLDSKQVDTITAKMGNASKTIEEKIKNGEKLSDEGKKKLVESMAYMGKGIALEVPMVATVTNLSKQAADSVKSASLTQVGKIKDIAAVLTTLSSNVPKDLALAKSSLGLYIDYAKANGIEIPKDASSVFN